ncbi:hypothetical protein AB205_0061850 [Aquarana catesbeiana]|uniref:BED-type domain-containing protein n=1 Tax=Aquarana catesbeiana TaxID=8400 RepID=A0A2G9QJ86_AQUCT|nr:hypothetical protein AB205_0061850 [Aquarana catesbeiana]
MSGRPPRRGRCSQATKRGQAGSVSTANSAGHGHDASSAPGHVEPQHAEELVERMTKPSSSFSSSVTQAQGTLSANAAAKAASSIGSMSSVTPSLAPPSCPEESPELFDHSVGYMLQEDAQCFEGSDDGTQVEDEGSIVSPERGGAQEGQETGSHVPPATAYCQVCSSGEEGGNDEVTDSTWVPDRREEEEAHLQRGRMLSRGLLKGRQLTESQRRAPHMQGTADFTRFSKSSLVWAFFQTCAADRTIAVCNICLKRIKHGQNNSCSGTTCLTRHMSSSHAVHAGNST